MKIKQIAVILMALGSALTVTVRAADAPAAPTNPATATAAPLGAIERSDARQATALLERAVDYLQANGPEKSLAAFNDRKGTFVSGQYYVFAIGLDGTLHASGGPSSGLVGLNVRDLRDAAGKPFIGDMLEQAKTRQSGSIEYQWINPADNHLETKTDQFRKVGDYIVCVGYYIPRASSEEAQAMLNKAVALLKKSGKKTAFKTFNDPHSAYVVNDEYVFAINLHDGKYQASGASPNLTGVDVRNLTDAAGKPLFKDMIALAKIKGSGTVDYVWRNPATNAVESKHTLIQRVGDVLLGVGYYTKN